MNEQAFVSCPHISTGSIQNCLKKIIELENSSCSYACMECDKMFSSLNKVKNHYCGDKHSIFLRLGHRPDLFCAVCDDFQYCSLFDRIIGKKRMIEATSEAIKSIPESSSVKASRQNYAGRTTCPGLVNMGSTCFMNSVLQVLAHCREFSSCAAIRLHKSNCNREAIGDLDLKLQTSSQPPVCLPCEFYRVSEALSGEGPVEPFIVPSQLLYSVWSYVDFMAGYTQQDAHEFLIVFLNSLNAQMFPDSNSSSAFSRLFTGEVQSQLECTVCGDISSTNESFIDLSLAVDSSNNVDVEENTRSAKDTVTIFDCIGHFTAKELLHEKVKCDNCNLDQPRTKKLWLVNTPDILVLHLKRFDYFKQKKVSSHVKFPIGDLSLAQYMLPNNSSPDELNSYQLIGVVCHSGTLHHGHYISYIFDRQLTTWMKCDDESVLPVEDSAVEEAEAYLLFYQKFPISEKFRRKTDD